MSFYRTYRPQIITELDNEHVRSMLLQLLSKDVDKLPHAFFLSGPKGAGKTTTARIIAKLFNCDHRTKEGPCGSCEQCTSIAHGTHMDVVEIDAASNRGIDDIRALRERIGLAPVHGKYTVYIIDEVHMLTTEACNALLKTLEEPPQHAVFVLATTDPQKVLSTIHSRCVPIHFSKASQNNLVTALSRIAKKEKITIDADALDMIADASDGAFRDAVKLLEQASFLEGAITKDHVVHMLAKSDEQMIEELCTMILSKKGKEAVTLIEQCVNEGKDIKGILHDTISSLHTKLLALVKGEHIPWTRSDLEDALHHLTNAYGELRLSPITQLPFELAILGYATLHDDHVSPKTSLSEKKVLPSVVPEKKDIPKETKEKSASTIDISDFLTIEKLASHWPDFIEALKPYNHSVAGVIRSTRPKAIVGDIVVIEALYPFHKDRLSESKAHDILTTVLKKLFGVKVQVEIVLANK